MKPDDSTSVLLQAKLNIMHFKTSVFKQGVAPVQVN